MSDFVLSIDIGGTNTKIGLVDQKGEVFGETSFLTQAENGINSFLLELKKEAMLIIADKPVVGVGVGAPNASHYEGAMIMPTNIRWGERVELQKLISNAFELPTVVTNDASAAAVGEMHYGGAKGMKNFVAFTLGTGLGSGIVVDGKAVYGHTGLAGEIGHVSVNPDGRYCGCGRRGCLETYVSATGLRKTVFKLMADYARPSVLRDISYNEMTAERITEAAINHDYIAIKAFEYTGRIFGQKLADTVVHTSPEAIFLFGGMIKAGDYLLDPAIYYMEKFMFKPFKNSVKLITTSVENNNAALLGASVLIWNQLKSK